MRIALVLLTLLALLQSQEDRIYDRAVGSVVLIEVEKEAEVIGIFQLLPPLDGFTKPPVIPEKKTLSSAGTGFSVNGQLVTCNHVIDKADKVFVVEKSCRRQLAKIIKVDEKKDLALLQVLYPIPSLRFAWRVKDREVVYQIGNPAIMRFVMTVGRVIGFDGTQYTYDITTFFGNSGSPLLNRSGEVVGMIHAVVPGSHITFGGTLDELREFLKP